MQHTFSFQKAYDAYRLISDLTERFPKKDRYTLGVRLETTTLDIIEAIAMAEATVAALKDRALVSATVKADVASVLIRLALERELVSETNYFTLAEAYGEIAKMATGWRKSLASAH
jgi:hypothetical protein